MPSKGPAYDQDAGRGLAFSLLAGASKLGFGHIVGQIANIAIQLLLLAQLAPEAYGRIGMAYLLVTTFLFVADLGYGQAFLRIPANKPGWGADWAAAQTHRLIFLSLGVPALMIGWRTAYPLDEFGFQYIAAAMPGIALSLFNFSVVAAARGKFTLVSLTMPVQPLVTLLATIVLMRSGYSGGELGSGLGLCFSLGVAIHVAFVAAALKDPRLFAFAMPARANANFLATALRLSALGLLGTLYERSYVWFVEAADPGFLPYYIFLSQISQGLLNVFAQVQRVVLPMLARNKWPIEIRNEALSALGLLFGAAALLGIAALFSAAIALEQQKWLAIGAKFLLNAASWVPQCLLVAIIALWISSNKEKQLLFIIAVSMAAAVPLCIVFAYNNSIFGIFVVKAVLCLFAWIATMRAFRLRIASSLNAVYFASTIFPIAAYNMTDYLFVTAFYYALGATSLLFSILLFKKNRLSGSLALR